MSQILMREKFTTINEGPIYVLEVCTEGDKNVGAPKTSCKSEYMRHAEKGEANLHLMLRR